MRRGERSRAVVSALPCPKTLCELSSGLIGRDVSHNREDRLIRDVFSRVKLNDIGPFNLGKRLFCAGNRPTIGMAGENDLFKRLSGHLSGIVFLALNLAQDLAPDSFQ